MQPTVSLCLHMDRYFFKHAGVDAFLFVWFYLTEVGKPVGKSTWIRVDYVKVQC